MKCTLSDYTVRGARRVENQRTQPEEILDLVRRLDGATYTDLCIEDDSGWALVVGGGRDRYVSVKFDSAGHSFAFLNPEAATTDLIELCVGGQLGEFEPSVVCSFEKTRAAVTGFFEEPSSKGPDWRPD